MNKGIRIWNKAIKIIPGGNGLLSKRPHRYLPNLWPTYYKKSKGLNIWDLNNKKYIDFCQMGVGTCMLGYANKFVDQAVKKAVNSGVNSSLNSIEEYLLAKKFLKYNKFADQIKFARGGGEAMSIAVRLARSQSGKDTVAFSGYHGWADWYLAANLKKKNTLDEYLVPDVDPSGVPKNLKNSIIPIGYNINKDLKKLNGKKIAAFVLEGSRYEYPSKSFLREIQKICKKKKICLIVDEITSGWRETIGGIYKKFNLKPDIVVFGKAIGNGYAISSILGKKKYMSHANKTFISSTAWTEKVGFAAGNATIDFFIKNKVYLHIPKIGKMITNGWDQIAKDCEIKMKFSEVMPLCTFFLDYSNKDELYTFFIKEMLKKGYLANNSVWLSYAHKEKDVKKYLKVCKEVFIKMKDFIDNKKKYKKIEVRYYGLHKPKKKQKSIF